ncbi:MAG: DUF1295 domain-containing protein, partial [Bdellovibrionales bacterium]|nr:DUF1295 domain-containing protein [Bdellovibrionales bacterium]
LYAIWYHYYSGWDQRDLILLSVIGVWAIRLSFHLLVDRIWKKPEEGRYQELRRSWKTNIPIKFFFFYQAQTLFNWLVCVPFLISSLSSETEVTNLDWLGVLIVVVGVIGESLSDFQLQRFKKRKDRATRVCREGLWNYSRHPNYFFVFLTWIGFSVFALSGPYGVGNLLGLIGPVFMFLTLYKVTGIPATEAHAVRTKGDEYIRYQNEVSEFFPIPKKKKL